MATILVVDDRSDHHERLMGILNGDGHELEEAADGAEALDKTRRDHPDLVIADILLPTMGGYEFVRNLRADPVVGATPLIFSTDADRRGEARILADRCGVSHLLTKPAAPEAVVRMVAEVLGVSRTDEPAPRGGEGDRDRYRRLNARQAERVRELEAANGRLVSLIELGRSLALERDADRLLAQYCRAGREMLGADLSILAMLGEGGKSFDRELRDGPEDAGSYGAGLAGPTEGLLGRVAAERATVRAEGRSPVIDPGHPPASSFLGVPVATASRLYGVLAFVNRRGDGRFDDADEGIARQVADQLAIAIRQASMYDQVRSGREQMRVLSRQLLRAQEAERRRIAREMHDEIGQSLTAVRINLQRAMAGPGLASTSSYLAESDRLIGHVLEQVRNISLDLRPCMLDDLGLAASMRSHLDRTARLAGFVGHFAADPPEIRLSPEIEAECFRIGQEALTNVVRHARARQVEVALSRRAERLELIVHDDGAGFDVAAARQHAARGGSLGLLGMQERAALLGGRITIEARPGFGTKVHLRVPLAAGGASPGRPSADRGSP